MANDKGTRDKADGLGFGALLQGLASEYERLEAENARLLSLLDRTTEEERRWRNGSTTTDEAGSTPTASSSTPFPTGLIQDVTPASKGDACRVEASPSTSVLRLTRGDKAEIEDGTDAGDSEDSFSVRLRPTLHRTDATVGADELKKAGRSSVDADALLAVMEEVDDEIREDSMVKTLSQIDDTRAQQTCLQRFDAFVHSQTFELFFLIVILLNAGVIALQLQYDGLNLGYQLDFHSYNEPASEVWPGAPQVFFILEVIFCLLFVVELVCRLAAYRLQWFFTFWSYLDLVIVVIAMLGLLEEVQVGVNTTMVRLARFAKIMRIVRVARSSRLLESLKLITTALVGSVQALFWSMCVLGWIQFVAGILLAQIVEPFLRNSSMEKEVEMLIFARYGTFWRAMVSMFVITLANWDPPCQLLLDHISEWFGVFFLAYRCVIGFAVLSIIQAVFIQQTFKSAQIDDDMLIDQKNRERAKNVQRIKRIFSKLDESGDGMISLDEVEAFMHDGKLKEIMSTLEVEAEDMQHLFTMMDDGDGVISLDEFVQGVQDYRGVAKAWNVSLLSRTIGRLESRMEFAGLSVPPAGWNASTHSFPAHSPGAG